MKRVNAIVHLETVMTKIHIEYRNIKEISGADLNPKDHDIGAIYQSIKRFGFTQPIMMNEKTGKLLAGHGRLQTLQTLKDAGEKVPNRIKEKDGEWLVPVLKGISFEDDNEAQAYLIADNRLTELGGWNTGELVDELERLIQAGLDLDGIGYDFDDLETMVSDMESRFEVEDIPNSLLITPLNSSILFSIFKSFILESNFTILLLIILFFS